MTLARDQERHPETIGRYRIERVLGSGAMGDVYLAQDTRLRRRVALKVLGAQAEAQGIDTAAAALREARAAGSIMHPNAAAIFDADEIDGLACVVMEYVPGTPLRRFIGDPAVPLPARLRWIVDVAGALAAAHAAGVVHRDVKPENVMVREDGVVKVLDFGIARVAQADPSDPPSFITPSHTGGFVGTPGYMAPEVLRGQEIDGRADQFGWGVLAYELLAGRSPWCRAEGALGALAAVLTERPEPLGDDVPPEISAVVLRALSKAPADRFPSLAVAAAALAPFAEPAAPSFQAPPISIVRSADLGSQPAPSPRPPSARTVPPPSIPARPRGAPTVPPPSVPARPSRPAFCPPPPSARPPRRVSSFPPPSVPARPSRAAASSFPPSRGSSSPPPPTLPSHTLAPSGRRTPPPRPAGLRAPDFEAPIDLRAHLNALPPDASCKGMFFNDLFSLAARAHTPAAMAVIAGIPERRYLNFRDYPMADALLLAVAVSAVVYPRLPLGEALRRLGQRALDLVLDSHMGRTLFASFGDDPAPFLLHGPKAYRLLVGFGDVSSEQIGEREFVLRASGLPLFLETYHVGVIEGVLAHGRRRGEVQIDLHRIDAAVYAVRYDA